MRHCTSGVRAFQSKLSAWFLALVFVLGAASVAEAGERPLEAEVRALLDPVWGTDLGGGMVLDEIDAQSHQIALVLHDGEGRRAARVVLKHPERQGHRVGSFSASLQTSFSQIRTERDRQTLDAIHAVVRTVDRRDPGDLGRQLRPAHPHPWLWRGVRAWRWLPAAVLALVILGWTRRDQLQWVLRPNHLVPAMIQCTLYTYWWLYTSPVQSRFVDIAAQLAFAYGFEGLLRWSRGRTWQVSLGPVPVVLSTNLFVWFSQPWLQCTAIAIALFTKEFVHRDGRHIFNPSAFAVATLAVATLTLPTVFGWGTPTPDVELNLPPNMAELMLILTVIAQLRFPIVLVPMAATLGVLIARLGGLSPPDPFWPATFLILLLFATDPKTLPSTTPGRVVYGLCLGVALSAISEVLSGASLPDTYAKVIPIPVLNYLAPQLDRLGQGAYDRWNALVSVEGSPARQALGRFLDPAYNRAHVALWVVIAVLGIANQKAASFQVLAHWQYETPGIVTADPLAFPTCADNPAWCTPFGFLPEARMWLTQPEPARLTQSDRVEKR